MSKVWTCLTSVGSCFVLAAVWGMLAFSGSALADKPDPDHNHGIQTDDEGNFKDIPVCIGFDDVGGDGVRSDGGEYCESKQDKIHARVGRNRILGLELLKGASRTLTVDLSGPLFCNCSTRIDVDPIDNVCDDPTPCSNDVPFTTFESLSRLRFNINTGEDLDDLHLGCTHEDNATLGFTFGDDVWLLRWGPYDGAGGPGRCPGSGHILVTRTGHTTWDFTTTGNHLACLYRQENPPHGATEYHGQFLMPFSGVATAIDMDQTAPVAACPDQEDRDRRGREFSPSCGLIGECS